MQFETFEEVEFLGAYPTSVVAIVVASVMFVTLILAVFGETTNLFNRHKGWSSGLTFVWGAAVSVIVVLFGFLVATVSEYGESRAYWGNKISHNVYEKYDVENVSISVPGAGKEYIYNESKNQFVSTASVFFFDEDTNKSHTEQYDLVVDKETGEPTLTIPDDAPATVEPVDPATFEK